MRFLAGFRAIDLLHIAIFAAIGLAIKQLVHPLAHAMSRPLLIPGGSLAGGLYMMWPALALAVVNRRGAALLTTFTQAVMVLALGLYGSHGAFSLVSYGLPGVAAELAGLPFRRLYSPVALVCTCTLANLTGCAAVSIVLLRLPLVPALIALATAGVSGIVGGLLARAVWVRLRQLHLVGEVA